MANLQGKCIILGVTGSIAAYKAAMLTRLLIKAGAQVQVLMTPGSTQFITPLTLSTLSKRSVYTQVSSEESWNSHVELGLWADAMVVAPLTANTLAKMAHGICDNIITATYLSARCPVFFAPAMDLDMWKHPSTVENVERLHRFGNHLIEVGTGELASGLVGAGRMAEPEAIVSTLGHYFRKADALHGRRMLITAGPTHEPIDPVRFIGNHSTGKMGIALAEEAAARGAHVHLILGPSALSTQHPRIELQRVQTADEMYEAALSVFPDCDAAIFSAAVADYRPAQPAEQKIKKSAEARTLQLVKNPDIAADLGQRKKAGQYTVGFALETQDAEANAKGKLERKNMDIIVLNTLEDEGAGFQHDTNKVSMLRKDNKKRSFELKPKREVAADIMDELQELAVWKKD
jgi:phosphopantothenoylcysteine decarboxylase / phosphopantothenate---cysteine ligase